LSKPNLAWTPEERLRLRQRRLDLGYSLVEIARRLGIAAEHLARAERGEGRLSHGLHRRLADLLRTLGPRPCRRPVWIERETFRARRLELGFSQTRVADIVGVSIDSLNGWERGRLVPTVHQQRDLARVLRRLETAPPDLRALAGSNQPKADMQWHQTLRERRVAVGLNQYALAVLAGTSQAAISTYERGITQAATFQAARIDAAIERERARVNVRRAI
jgi:transcriptional regulator with XRE-family HTH domain